LLEVPQQDNLAIDFIEFGQYLLQSLLQFVANRRGCRRQLPVSKLGDKLDRRFFDPRRWSLRLFPVDATAVGLAVPPMRINNPVLGHVPEPKCEWHLWVVQIVAEPAVRVEQDFLHDVAGILAAHQLRIEAQLDSAMQRFAAIGEELVKRAVIAGANLVEQGIHTLWIRPHVRPGLFEGGTFLQEL
jgi:hypothetical protein